MDPVTLLLLGTAAFFLLRGKKPDALKETLTSLGDDEAADLTKQAFESTDGFFVAETMQQIVKTGALKDNARLKEAYALLQQKVSTMQPTREVTAGRSGHRYRMRIVNVFLDGVIMVDIFSTSGSKLMRFSMNLDGSKKFITAAGGADPSLVKTARADFNLSE